MSVRTENLLSRTGAGGVRKSGGGPTHGSPPGRSQLADFRTPFLFFLPSSISLSLFAAGVVVVGVVAVAVVGAVALAECALLVAVGGEGEDVPRGGGVKKGCEGVGEEDGGRGGGEIVASWTTSLQYESAVFRRTAPRQVRFCFHFCEKNVAKRQCHYYYYHRRGCCYEEGGGGVVSAEERRP